MLFPEIKSYLIEVEIEEINDEEYIQEIESCRSIEQLMMTISDWKNLDEFESAHYILKQVCNY